MGSTLKMGALRRRFLLLTSSADYKAAVAFQRDIAALVPGKPAANKIATVCGIDVSFSKETEELYAAAAVYSYPALKPIEERAIADEVLFPYIPGLLAFREGPAVLKLIESLSISPDLFIFDGHGISHPRKTGIASMMGLLLDKPSIGCAKTKLVGDYREPGKERGSTSELLFHGNVVGVVLRTRANVKPVFVSVGYKFRLDDAVMIVLGACRRFRLPEPIRHAHILSNKLRKQRAGLPTGPG